MQIKYLLFAISNGHQSHQSNFLIKQISLRLNRELNGKKFRINSISVFEALCKRSICILVVHELAINQNAIQKSNANANKSRRSDNTNLFKMTISHSYFSL